MKKPEWVNYVSNLEWMPGFMRGVISYIIGLIALMSPTFSDAATVAQASPEYQRWYLIFQLLTVMFGCGIVAMKFAYDFVKTVHRIILGFQWMARCYAARKAKRHG